jgi:hypothetical protein
MYVGINGGLYMLMFVYPHLTYAAGVLKLRGFRPALSRCGCPTKFSNSYLKYSSIHE